MMEINRKNFPGLYWLGRCFVSLLAALLLLEMLSRFGWPTSPPWVFGTWAVLWIAAVLGNVPRWIGWCLSSPWNLLTSFLAIRLPQFLRDRPFLRKALRVSAGLALFIVALECFSAGDRDQHYNGYLVTTGWFILMIGAWALRGKPSIQEVSSFLTGTRNILAALLPYGVAVLVAWLWLGDGWHSPLRYSIQYGVPLSEISKPEKPHDCDFLTAPLGIKNCRYDLHEQIVKTAMSTTGVPIVSYDEGKTWAFNNGSPPVKPQVILMWEKIDE